MSGLYLGGMGGARASAGNGMSNAPAAATASAMAFGSGYAATQGSPNRLSSLLPNDPFGVSLWAAVVATGLLIYIRHSLPA